MSLKSTIDNIYKRWKDIKEYVDSRIQYASLILGKNVDNNIKSQLIKKQDMLVAGDNISIKDNVISFTPTGPYKEHVVDFTFRQRKRVKFQNRVLLSDYTQEWPLFLEIGHIKNIEKGTTQVELNIPFWFTSRDFNTFGNTYIELAYRGARYKSNFYKAADCFTVETRERQRVLLIDLIKLLSSIDGDIVMLRVFARNMKQGPKIQHPYILTYTPQGIRREPLYNDCDVKVMHNHFTMKVRCGRLYKGDFDMPVKSKASNLSISRVCRDFIKLFESKIMPDSLNRHLWIKVRIGNKRNTKSGAYFRNSYSHSAVYSSGDSGGYSHRSSKEWVFVPLTDIDDLFRTYESRQIAFTQEAWSKSSTRGQYKRTKTRRRRCDNYKNYSPISNKRGWVFYTHNLKSAIQHGLSNRILNIRRVYEDRDIFVCKKTKKAAKTVKPPRPGKV